jgi:predicted porin
MKKSLIALAVLGFAGVASAQSSVTLYGRVDLSIGKPLYTAQKGMFNGSGSRLGVRGVEDLGGGLKGIFHIEHRFDADTGASSSSTRFWTGRSIVGVEGGFGRVTLGREYTTSFSGSQVVADPWGFDTVVAGTGTPNTPATLSGRGVTSAIATGLIGTVRNDSAITYTAKFGGVSFGAQTAERTDAINNVAKRPFNLNVGFAGGPVNVYVGYEAPGNSAKWTSAGIDARFGAFKPGLFYGTGKASTGNKHNAIMLTGVAYLGAGELRLAAGTLKAKPAAGGTNTTVVSGLAAGYHHSLSKRTTVYADFVRNSKITDQKTGYDFGLKHNF